MKTIGKQTKKELIAYIQNLEAEKFRQHEMNRLSFNKYDFINTLKDSIKDEIVQGNINHEDDIRKHINEAIDNECIYYHNCFQIAMELRATDFTAFDSEINNISTLAYYALDEYVNSELNISELNDLIAESYDKTWGTETAKK